MTIEQITANIKESIGDHHVSIEFVSYADGDNMYRGVIVIDGHGLISFNEKLAYLSQDLKMQAASWLLRNTLETCIEIAEEAHV